MNSRKRITVALVGLVLLVAIGWLIRDGLGAKAQTPQSGSLSVRALSTLPPEAKRTWQLINSGGPFPYPGRDGVEFGNRERRLPRQKPGYYHEYTVPTPGARDRGAQRLITGSRAELYYTGDHYDSFVIVDPKR